MMINLALPYKFDSTGRTAQTDAATHVRDMIELILFTSSGERVNRSTFGSGTTQLVFEPNSEVLAAAQQQAIQFGLQQWLPDLIQVQSVVVVSEDSTLSVTVKYLLLATNQSQSEEFLYGGQPQ
ncbi:MAG TPA: GPW/gp25 family protein [Edaphobacter sp.]|nr:GPW/gp25 family protein [Edaphobacter sp.]